MPRRPPRRRVDRQRGQDGTAAIRSATLDKPPPRLGTFGTAVSDIVFAQDGTRVVAAGYDGGIAALNAATGDRIERLVESGRPVSHTFCARFRLSGLQSADRVCAPPD